MSTPALPKMSFPSGGKFQFPERAQLGELGQRGTPFWNLIPGQNLIFSWSYLTPNFTCDVKNFLPVSQWRIKPKNSKWVLESLKNWLYISCIAHFAEWNVSWKLNIKLGNEKTCCYLTTSCKWRPAAWIKLQVSFWSDYQDRDSFMIRIRAKHTRTRMPASEGQLLVLR